MVWGLEINLKETMADPHLCMSHAHGHTYWNLLGPHSCPTAATLPTRRALAAASSGAGAYAEMLRRVCLLTLVPRMLASLGLQLIDFRLRKLSATMFGERIGLILHRKSVCIPTACNGEEDIEDT
jgi:hypothetical protein